MAATTPDLTRYATVDDPCPFCGECEAQWTAVFAFQRLAVKP